MLRKISDLIFLETVTFYDLTLNRLLKVQKRLHESGFSGSVLTYNTEIISRFHFEIDIFRNDL